VKHIEPKKYFNGNVASELVEASDGSRMTIGEVLPGGPYDFGKAKGPEKIIVVRGSIIINGRRYYAGTVNDTCYIQPGDDIVFKALADATESAIYVCFY
jgi:uncharacterized protein YaiE (UPF0345 family)